MNHRQRAILFGMIAIMTAINLHAYDQVIKGAAKVKLSGPITEEQMAACKQDARLRLKPEVVIWLEDQKGAEVDTNEVLVNLLFDTFLDSCIVRAKEASAFKDKYWTFTYSLLPEAIEAALKAYNDRIELLAVHSWERLQNAVAEQNHEEMYYQSVEVIAYSMAYMGRPLTVQGDESRLLIDEARKTLKSFLERVRITSTGQLIEGKAGRLALTPPSLSVTIDGRPFAGLGLTGYIPGGIDVFNGVADNSGKVSLDNFMIPFVRNGTLMYLSPNLGRVINNKWRVGIKHFGITTRNDLSQPFFFKIKKSTYSLKFEAIATDPTDTIPRDIASGALMKKFLTDSCYLEPVSHYSNPDLDVIIKCSVSTAGSSETESGEARFTALVTIRAPFLTPPRTESESIVYEKRYDKILVYYNSKKKIERISSVPIGSFLWEANVKLREGVRKILVRL
ncbi:MAG: hypothetical protein JXA71_05150 [Chitinispirillaceae bacterium]|nr:hypothetical protein [Chitinispirillaceae bacterium]